MSLASTKNKNTNKFEMAESSQAAFANNVVPSTKRSRNHEVDMKQRKDKKEEDADPIAWYFEAKAKAGLKKRKQWEANEQQCIKERPRNRTYRCILTQTRRKYKDLQQVDLEYDNLQVDLEENLEQLTTTLYICHMIQNHPLSLIVRYFVYVLSLYVHAIYVYAVMQQI